VEELDKEVMLFFSRVREKSIIKTFFRERFF